jgi:hypothetical protein
VNIFTVRGSPVIIPGKRVSIGPQGKEMPNEILKKGARMCTFSGSKMARALGFPEKMKLHRVVQKWLTKLRKLCTYVQMRMPDPRRKHREYYEGKNDNLRQEQLIRSKSPDRVKAVTTVYAALMPTTDTQGPWGILAESCTDDQ